MEAHRPRKMDKSQSENRPYPRLCIAVVTQACRDYYHALQRYKHMAHLQTDNQRLDRDGVYCEPQWAINECEDFFLHEMSLYSDYDGEWLIKEIRRMVDDSEDD